MPPALSLRGGERDFERDFFNECCDADCRLLAEVDIGSILTTETVPIDVRDFRFCFSPPVPVPAPVPETASTLAVLILFV